MYKALKLHTIACSKGLPGFFLYLTSNEEIKRGDYVVNMYNGTSIFKITKVFSDGYEGMKLGEEGVFYGLQSTLRKIVATDNPDVLEKMDTPEAKAILILEVIMRCLSLILQKESLGKKKNKLV